MKKFTLYDGQVRFVVLGSSLIILILCVVLRLCWLQIIRAEELKEWSDNQLEGILNGQVPRGRIVDRDGEELAVSILSKSLYVDPKLLLEDKAASKQLPKRDARRISADLLAPVLKMDAEELYEIFSRSGRFWWVKRTLEPKEAEQVRKIIKDNKLSGLVLSLIHI